VKIKAWIITFIVIAAVLFGLYFYKQPSLSTSTKDGGGGFEPSATVEAIETTSSPFKKTVQVTGVVKAPKQLVLKNELAGKITELSLPSGKVIKKGQTLLTLDSTNEQASLVAAKARVTLANQTLKRYKNLVARNEISAELVDKATSDLAIANSDVIALNTRIEKKTITAPFDAIVGLHELTTGQYLDSSSSIANLVGMSDVLWVEFSLPQSYSALALNESVNVNSSSGVQLSANIIALEPTLTSQSRQLKYRAQFGIKDHNIKPYSLVNVVAPISKAESKISIPDVALTNDQFGHYVFTLTPDEGGKGAYRAKRKQVWIVLKNEAQAVIEKGLEVGEMIATTGAFKLRDGMKVYIAQSSNTAK